MKNIRLSPMDWSAILLLCWFLLWSAAHFVEVVYTDHEAAACRDLCHSGKGGQDVVRFTHSTPTEPMKCECVNTCQNWAGACTLCGDKLTGPYSNTPSLKAAEPRLKTCKGGRTGVRFPGLTSLVFCKGEPKDTEKKMSEIAKRIGAKLANTQAVGGGNFINPGKGIIVVTKLIADGRPRFYEGDTFVLEGIVLDNTPFPGVKDENGKDKPAGNAPGSSISYVQQLEKFKDTAWPNTLAALQGVVGPDMSAANQAARAAEESKKRGVEVTAQEIFAEDFDFLVSDDQPARGTLVAFSTYEKTTVKSKKAITCIKWEHIHQSDEDIAKRRALLDAGKPVVL